MGIRDNVISSSKVERLRRREEEEQKGKKGKKTNGIGGDEA
jgi:hypothetical protein